MAGVYCPRNIYLNVELQHQIFWQKIICISLVFYVSTYLWLVIYVNYEHMVIMLRVNRIQLQLRVQLCQQTDFTVVSQSKYSTCIQTTKKVCNTSNSMTCICVYLNMNSQINYIIGTFTDSVNVQTYYFFITLCRVITC